MGSAHPKHGWKSLVPQAFNPFSLNQLLCPAKFIQDFSDSSLLTNSGAPWLCLDVSSPRVPSSFLHGLGILSRICSSSFLWMCSLHPWALCNLLQASQDRGLWLCPACTVVLRCSSESQHCLPGSCSFLKPG